MTSILLAGPLAYSKWYILTLHRYKGAIPGWFQYPRYSHLARELSIIAVEGDRLLDSFKRHEFDESYFNLISVLRGFSRRVLRLVVSEPHAIYATLTKCEG